MDHHHYHHFIDEHQNLPCTLTQSITSWLGLHETHSILSLFKWLNMVYAGLVTSYQQSLGLTAGCAK